MKPKVMSVRWFRRDTDTRTFIELITKRGGGMYYYFHHGDPARPRTEGVRMIVTPEGLANRLRTNWWIEITGQIVPEGL